MEPKYTLIITLHHRPAIRSISIRILHIIETFGVGFPYVNLYTVDGFAGCVFDCAEDETGFSLGIVGDATAIGGGLSFLGVEGTEDSAFG